MTAIPRQWSHNNITVCHLFRQSSQKSKPLFKTSTENPAQPVCPSKYGVNLTLLAATMLTILAMENRQNPVPVQKLCPNSEVIPMVLYLGKIIYRTRAIITRGLYSFYPLFGVQKRFFLKILDLCMVSIQERFLIKSGLWWRAYGTLTDYVFVPM